MLCKQKRWVIRITLFVLCGGILFGFAVYKGCESKVPRKVSFQFWDDKEQKFVEGVSPLNRNTKTVVLIHGLVVFGIPHWNWQATDWLPKVAQAIRRVEPDTNILAIDWSGRQKQLQWNWIESCVPLPHPFAVAGTLPPLAEAINFQLFAPDKLNLAPDKTHLIGFSHGAHLAGLVGMQQNGQIRRITLLDASTRLSHLQSGNILGSGWDKTAAQFIDVYATSLWEGTGATGYGQKNFWVTYKDKRSNSWLEAFDPVTAHRYAAFWFITTIRSGETDFGYAMQETAKTPVDGWAGLIESTLPPSQKEDFDKVSNTLYPVPEGSVWHGIGDIFKDVPPQKENLVK